MLIVLQATVTGTYPPNYTLARYLDVCISQGSVSTCLRCGGITFEFPVE